MNLNWEESLDDDFWKYEIHYGINDSLNTIILDSIFDKYETHYSINEFDPYIYNFFQITVYDTLNRVQKVILNQIKFKLYQTQLSLIQ